MTVLLLVHWGKLITKTAEVAIESWTIQQLCFFKKNKELKTEKEKEGEGERENLHVLIYSLNGHKTRPKAGIERWFCVPNMSAESQVPGPSILLGFPRHIFRELEKNGESD